MKNNVFKLLFLLLTLSLSIAVSCGEQGCMGCGQEITDESGISSGESFTSETLSSENSHNHELNILKSDSRSHWYECECGLQGEFYAHKGGTATCSFLAKCSLCGEEYGSLNSEAHLYDIVKFDQEYHWSECACGKSNERVEHYGGIASCTNKAKCTVCQTEYGETDPNAHDYSKLDYDGSSHWFECECGERTEKENHHGGIATCVNRAVCTICESDYGELANHAYVNNTCKDCFANYSTPGLNFDYIDGVYTVTGIVFGSATTEENLVIPSKNGTVKAIAPKAFNNCVNIKSVVIPSSVKTIGKDAFLGCTGLEAVYIDSLVSWCQADIESNPLSNDCDLYVNYELVTDIEIPKNIRQLKKGVFLGCNSIYSVTMHDAITEIGEKAFYGCDNLITVFLPQRNLHTIGDSAFSGCNNLVNIKPVGTSGNVNGFTPSLTKIGERAFYNCSNILGEITLNCTEIGERAFYGCKGLEWVSIKNLQKIEDSTFYGCTKLSYVSFDENLTEIGTYAFRGCAIKTLVLPEGLVSIGESAFDQCKKLKSVSFPSTLTSVGKSAFYICDQIEEVFIKDLAKWLKIDFANYDANPLFYGACISIPGQGKLEVLQIPQGITEIKPYSITGASLKEVVIPSSVEIFAVAKNFRNCSNLQRFTVSSENPFYSSIDGHLYTQDGSELLQYAFAQTDNYVVPDTLSKISTSFPEGLKNVEVGNLATWCSINFLSEACNPIYYAKRFSVNGECVAILQIPETVTEISSYAFYSCYGLIGVDIPESLTKIGSYAFNDCINLLEINNKSSLDIKKGTGTHGYVGYYAKHIYNSDQEESKLSVTQDGLVLYVDDQGDTYVCAYVGSSPDVTIVDAKVKAYAFYNNEVIKTVTLGSGVTAVNSGAFENCDNLIEVNFGTNVSSIGEGAFENCVNLQTVNFKSGGITFGLNAFFGCSNLRTCTVKYRSDWLSNKFVNSYASPLYYSRALYIDGKLLTEISLPSNLKSINDYAFYNCDSLKTVIVNSYLTSIGKYAFYDCDSLKTVSISGGGSVADKIYDYAFAECRKLENYVTAHTYIGAGVFKDCEMLTSVVIGSNITTIGTSAFEGCTSLVEVSNYSSLKIEKGKTTNGYVAYYAKHLITSRHQDSKLQYVNNCTTYIEGLEVILIKYKGEEENVVLPNNVTKIDYYAFRYTNATSAILPISLKEIEEGAIVIHKSMTVYYEGSERDWNNVSKSEIDAKYLTVYYYVENEDDVPTDSGNYWHYDEDGNVVHW